MTRPSPPQKDWQPEVIRALLEQLPAGGSGELDAWSWIIFRTRAFDAPDPRLAKAQLDELARALNGLGKLAAAAWHFSMKRTEPMDLRRMARAAELAAEHVGAAVDTTPLETPAPYVAKMIARCYLELTRKCPPTTDPYDEAAKEPAYHRLFRELFALAGLPSWKRHAREAARALSKGKNIPRK